MMNAELSPGNPGGRSRPKLRQRSARGAAAALLVGVAGLSASATPPPMSDEEIIWQNEQTIYAGRADGNINFYVDHADPDYAGWPPQFAAPLNYDALVASAKRGAGQKGEALTLEKSLIKIHRNGNVALAFYKTHRTKRAGGVPVDEVFEDIHVWVKDPQGWRLMGGMARPVPVNRESLGGSVPGSPMPPEAKGG